MCRTMVTTELEGASHGTMGMTFISTEFINNPLFFVQRARKSVCRPSIMVLLRPSVQDIKLTATRKENTGKGRPFTPRKEV